MAIAAYFETEGLTELADLFHQQSTEERDHAMRFVKYVTDAGGSLKIPAIPAPRAEFTDACDASNARDTISLAYSTLAQKSSCNWIRTRAATLWGRWGRTEQVARRGA